MLALSADMDESSSLLDLLECSVCLERLDTTAKVLPCQHTFCRRCLENIVSSRNELRCPECRILVDCGVDDLPANILLVRLLDGIKQRPQRGSGGGGGGGGGGGAGGRLSLAGGSLQGYAAGISASPPGSAIRELPVAIRSSPVKGTSDAWYMKKGRHHTKTKCCNNIPALPCGKALYTYEGKEPGDLQFSKGDIIILRRKVDDNWYHGELSGRHGFLPASYIQLLRPLSQTPPQGKALYDFEVKDKDQDKDCLAFSKDEVLTVIRRVDENWAEGMLGDKIGIFPILYVELNETAKQLMEMDKAAPTNAPGPSSEPAPLGPCSPGPSPRASPSNGNSSSHRRGEGKKNAKKRHSFSALSVSQRAAQLNNRHSMEISHPVLISSSDPRAAARIQDASHPGPSPSLAGALVPPKVASITSELLAHAKVQLPLNIYLALYAYKPQKADELELRKGEMYRVTEKCQDGWFKGTSLRTAASGVFPGNYVTPVSRAPFGVASSRGSSSSSSVGGGVGGSGCSKAPDPSSPGSTGPSSSRPSTPLGNSVNGTGPASSPQTAAAQLKKCLHFSQHAVNQTRTSMQLVHSPPAGSPERTSVALSPLRPQGSSPSRCPGQSCRPLSMVSPGPSLGPSPLSSPASRPLLPLSSPLSCLTPPSVSPALLNGDPAGPLQPPSPGPSQCVLAPKPEKERKAGGLLKLLSGHAAKKKPRSPPSSPPTNDPSLAGHGAVATDAAHHPRHHHHHGRSGSCPMASHGRAGSCPIEGETAGAIGLEPLHRKSGSLDTNFPLSPPATRASNGLMVLRPEPKPLSRERYRVVVPYPPQSEAEIELREGDVVFVHKKREDGWFKGTLQRTGQTGLFPSSFVESF
ncbi:E3 ubiquitin-protein ligase SH3RF3-like isoform X2 [Pungitius pungitius]|uniref:E3 ubiquitin-protein ligase SH3RF3-like isoform X2 n=1 Tax=Pungitius pungitius TaxID=134920 RepID=UPI002E0E0C61